MIVFKGYDKETKEQIIIKGNWLKQLFCNHKYNRIDIFLMDYNKARQLGRKTAKVWVLGKEK